MKVIKQYAVDVLIDLDDPMEVDIDEEEIARALESMNYNVLGSGWRATWTEDGYHNGNKPYDCD